MKPDAEHIRADFTNRGQALLEKYGKGKTLFEKLFQVALFGEQFNGKQLLFLYAEKVAVKLTFFNAEDGYWCCKMDKTTTPIDPIMLLALLMKGSLCRAILLLEKYGLDFSLSEVVETTLPEIEQQKLTESQLDVLDENDSLPLHAIYVCLWTFELEIQQAADTGIIPAYSLPAKTSEPIAPTNDELIARCSYEVKDETELVRRHFEPSDRLQAKLFMTTTDIFNYLANRYGADWFRGDLARLGKLMNKQGYDKARSKHAGVYGYFLLLKDTEADAA
jgi:hypothetical protein